MRKWIIGMWLLVPIVLSFSGCGGGTSSTSSVPGGTIDSSFGTQGLASYAPQAITSGDTAVIQPDGKIVVLGVSGDGTTFRYFLARFSHSGSVDTSFGNGGIVYGPYNGESALCLQNDGKILVVGNTFLGTNTITYIARYDSDGHLDPSFGNGGLVQTNSSNNEGNARVATQSDGRIVVTGTEHIGGPTPFIMRLKKDGSTDATFGDGLSSKVYLPVGGAVSGLALGNTDEIHIGVTDYSSDYIGIGTSIYKFDRNGIADTSFGSNGKASRSLQVSRQGGFDLKVQPDGKVVAALGIDNLYHGGVISSSSFSAAYKVVAQAAQPTGLLPWSVTSQWYGVAILRFDSHGSPDTGFGNGGSAMFTSGTRGISVSAIAVQPDGKFVMAGVDYNDPAGFPTGFAVMRLNSDGTIDNSFGTGGLVNTPFGPNGGRGNGIILQGPGAIVVVGTSDSSLVLGRYYQ